MAGFFPSRFPQIAVGRGHVDGCDVDGFAYAGVRGWWFDPH